MSIISISRIHDAVRRAIVGAVLAGAGLGAAAADAAPRVALIDPDELVFDRTQAEWSEAYLQWVAIFTRDGGPIADATGALCAARQEGDVWFLAMSDGTQPVLRTCAVPAGKTLFVPIASTMERSGSREPDCDSMARIAAGALVQHVSRLSLTIDGRAIGNLSSYRAATRECFALGLRQTPRSTARTAVADGYYVMLEPLPAGPHMIAVEARFDSTLLSTTYRLDVR